MECPAADKPREALAESVEKEHHRRQDDAQLQAARRGVSFHRSRWRGLRLNCIGEFPKQVIEMIKEVNVWIDQIAIKEDCKGG